MRRPRAMVAAYAVPVMAALLVGGLLLSTRLYLNNQLEFLLANRTSSGWILHNLQMEVVRLRRAADLFVHDEGNTSRDQLMLRLDILASRVPLLIEGYEARIMRESPETAELHAALVETVNQLDRLMPALQPGDQEGLEAIHGLLRPLLPKIVLLGNRARIIDPEGYYSANIRQAFAKLSAYIIVVSMLAAGVILWLFQQARSLRRAGRALQQREAMFKGIVDNLPMPFILKGADGRIQVANPAFLEMSGRAGDDVAGLFAADVVPEEANESFMASDRRVLAERATEHLPFRWQTKMGVREGIVSRFPLHSPGGQAAIGVVALDLTEQRLAESLLRRAIEVPNLNFSLFNHDDRLVISNQRFREFYEAAGLQIRPGVSHQDIINAQSARMRTEGLGDMAIAWREARLRRRDKPSRSQRFKLGAHDWFEVSDYPLEGGMILTLEDSMNSRIALEQSLLQAQKMESIGQLTGGIAHDFNNILSVITGHADLLQIQLDAHQLGEMDRSIAAIQQAGNRCAQLTQQLLAFARRQPLQARAVNIQEVVEGMRSMLSRTLGETIRIDTTAQPGLWSALVDPLQLENTLLNLAINARDAMPNGGRLSIRASNAVWSSLPHEACAELRPGDYLSLEVSDNGVGMDAETLGRAFEPFFTTKPVGRGSGLGLSMVYGFARQSGGYVQLTSEPGVGTTLQLLLPRIDKAPEPLPPEREVSSSISETRAEAGRVLVVEDEHAVRSMTMSLLRSLGYVPTGVASVQEALATLGTLSVDAVLTDIVLPDRSGRELAARLRETHPDLPILFMTGYSGELFVADQDADILRKPFNREQLARGLGLAIHGVRT